MTLTLAVSATFTAEPIEPVLAFWGEKLRSPFEIRFAPYNQIVQTLLDPAGEFAANRQGVNILLVRVQDLGQFEAFDAVRIEANLLHLVALIRESPGRFSVPLIVAFCPDSKGLGLRAHAMLQGIPGVVALSPESIERLYPVANPYNPEGERLGRIPYTDLYFAALGTAVVRVAHNLLNPPAKAIALDCDNTLWRGICGEDGPRGITVDPGRRQLQEFMLRQREQGMLLTMASKNNERDVLETFEQNPDMPLQLRHFAGWRIDWESKGGNLADLARELSLGIDSFIFVDDNPKETAEAAESVPEVLSLTLPEDEDEIPRFLDHVWAFDHIVVTEEDRQRNLYYEQARDFGRELKQAASLEHFVESLDLRVAFQPLTPESLPRAAQLTQRTNQFNFTTIRRTEPELQGLDAEVLTLQVSDRFGDYGITGVLIYREAGHALEIDTFLLSCRVLGRGVEQRAMNHLGQIALDRGLETIHLPLTPTKRNEPARQFLAELGGDTLSAAAMRDLRPRAAAAPPASEKPAKSAPTRQRPDYQDIAVNLQTPAQILQAVRGPGHGDPLLAIWSELLHRTDIGPDDNFFDLGGHSLLVVLLIVRVRETFGVDLAIDDVYAANLTLSGLSARIEAYQLGYDAILKELEGLPDEEIDRLLAQTT
jgi:FkbH-like protein